MVKVSLYDKLEGLDTKFKGMKESEEENDSALNSTLEEENPPEFLYEDDLNEVYSAKRDEIIKEYNNNELLNQVCSGEVSFNDKVKDLIAMRDNGSGWKDNEIYEEEMRKLEELLPCSCLKKSKFLSPTNPLSRGLVWMPALGAGALLHEYLMGNGASGSIMNNVIQYCILPSGIGAGIVGLVETLFKNSNRKRLDNAIEYMDKLFYSNAFHDTARDD
jgi:hypothetical protein